MQVNILDSASLRAIWKVPVVSILATMIGIPVHSTREFLNVYVPAHHDAGASSGLNTNHVGPRREGLLARHRTVEKMGPPHHLDI